MTDQLFTAFTLMLVGMLTVFGMLTLVYLGGKAIILIGNKFDFSIELEVSATTKTNENSETNIAIISAVVNKITDGKAKNITIKKIS